MDQPIQSYDIIISGAGPTGLMLACQLARFGANFLILDKKNPGHLTSRQEAWRFISKWG
jgi:2-polyprenyl-6-methoxyphenol hydroxylase-like FAD-dependent oxidoreductase